jgi:hypothetical protein
MAGVTGRSLRQLCGDGDVRMLRAAGNERRARLRNSSTHSADYQRVINEWDIATREREFAEAIDRSRELEMKVLSVILGISEGEVRNRWEAARAAREPAATEQARPTTSVAARRRRWLGPPSRQIRRGSGSFPGQ